MAHIQFKRNGVWKAYISDGSEYNGKRVRKTKTFHVDPGKTQRAQELEVRKLVTQWEADVLRGKITTGGKVPFSQLAADWMEDFKRGAPSEISIKRNQDMLDSRILPQFGRAYIQDLRPTDISKFLTFLAAEKPRTKRGTGKTLSGTYQKKYFTLLKAILQKAVSWGYITVNPAAAITGPRLDTPEVEPYNAKEAARLLEVLKEKASIMWCAYFMLALYTQVRRGELVGLDWAQVDLVHRVIDIRQSAYYSVGQGMKIKSTKTPASKRIIRLSEEAALYLDEWRKEQLQKRLKLGAEWVDSGAVFTQWDGSRLNIDSPSRQLREFLKENCLPPIKPHGLRHTGATLLISQGVDVQTVRQRLGHARASTTLDIYAHAFKERDDLATDALDQVLKQARKEAK